MVELLKLILYLVVLVAVILFCIRLCQLGIIIIKGWYESYEIDVLYIDKKTNSWATKKVKKYRIWWGGDEY